MKKLIDELFKIVGYGVLGVVVFYGLVFIATMETSPPQPAEQQASTMRATNDR